MTALTSIKTLRSCAQSEFSVQNYVAGFPSCTQLSSPAFLQNTHPSLVRKHQGFGPIIFCEQLALWARPTQRKPSAHRDALPRNLLWRATQSWPGSPLSARNSSVTSELLGNGGLHTPPLKTATNRLWVKRSHGLLETRWQPKPCFENKLCNLQDFQKGTFSLLTQSSFWPGYGLWAVVTPR